LCEEHDKDIRFIIKEKVLVENDILQYTTTRSDLYFDTVVNTKSCFDLNGHDVLWWNLFGQYFVEKDC
jgi:hypothetical protein